MSFTQHLKEHWPPVIDGHLVRSAKSNKLSNYFTQYLEWVMAEYVRESPGCYLVREVECDKHRHKLDYMIAEGDSQEYFTGKNPKEVNWVALVEAQWGNAGLSGVSNFLSKDFPKLTEWKTTKRKKQVKVAAVHMSPMKYPWKKAHDIMMKSLRDIANKDSDSRYIIVITTRLTKERKLAFTLYERWKAKKRSEIDYL